MLECFARYRSSFQGPRGRRLLGLVAVVLAFGPAEPSPAQEGSDGAAQPQPSVGTFLVARQGLPDPNFFQTVVLLLAYDETSGAVGVVVNRRSDVLVNEAVDAAGPFAERQDRLYFGGPVAIETMIVLLRAAEPTVESSPIVEDVFMVEGNDHLDNLMRSDPSTREVRFYAGYAGWGVGQLEDEISRGVWHLVSGRPGWVFSESPEKAWEELIRILFSPRA